MTTESNIEIKGGVYIKNELFPQKNGNLENVHGGALSFIIK